MYVYLKIIIRDDSITKPFPIINSFSKEYKFTLRRLFQEIDNCYDRSPT